MVRLILPVLLCLAVSSCEDAAAPTVLITNALVYDGSGSTADYVSVRIQGDRILELGDLDEQRGDTVVNADGLALAPGFIDSHSHHDEDFRARRDLGFLLNQGVTTIIRGADGFSDTQYPKNYIAVSEINQRIASTPLPVNVGSFSPHNSIRYLAMGSDFKRPATEAEIARMAEILLKDLENGALGMSTGLEYEPGIYSRTEELIELAKVVAEKDGRYMSHLRDEDDRFLEALDEIIEIGKSANVPVHISHIKLADASFWGSAEAVIAKLDEARLSGIDISADIYPYVRWQANLGVLFPNKNFFDRDTAIYTFEHSAKPADIYVTQFSPDPGLEGMTIEEIAEMRRQDPVDTLLNLSARSHEYLTRTGMAGSNIIVKGMSEDDVVDFMQWDYTNLCSDGSHTSGHPRGNGSFPRFLNHFVGNLEAMSMAKAINKMTQLSARNVGIKNRGSIQPGFYADLVLFDPALIKDNATMEDPLLQSDGIVTVWVNGVVAYDKGEVTGQYPGRVIRN